LTSAFKSGELADVMMDRDVLPLLVVKKAILVLKIPQRFLGETVEILLFGSRVDDVAKGGRGFVH
jgi:hypothetical protein